MQLFGFSALILSISASASALAACPKNPPTDCTIKTKPRSGTICGAFGSVRQPEILRANCAASFKQCQQACVLFEDECKAFSVNGKTGGCILYKSTIENMGIMPNKKNPNEFFDKICFKANCK